MADTGGLVCYRSNLYFISEAMELMEVFGREKNKNGLIIQEAGWSLNLRR